MNELREQVQEVVRAVTAEGAEWAKYGGGYPKIDEATDRILALIAEAMLSDEAVDAAIGFHYQANTEGGHGLRPYTQQMLQAALTAAGITGADTTD